VPGRCHDGFDARHAEFFGTSKLVALYASGQAMLESDSALRPSIESYMKIYLLLDC
jgi:hypothetical protein